MRCAISTHARRQRGKIIGSCVVRLRRSVAIELRSHRRATRRRACGQRFLDAQPLQLVPPGSSEVRGSAYPHVLGLRCGGHAVSFDVVRIGLIWRFVRAAASCRYCCELLLNRLGSESYAVARLFRSSLYVGSGSVDP